MSRVHAIRVHSTSEGPRGRLEEVSVDSLSDGEVVIEVHHSSLNFKDALAVTGRGKILKKFPLVAGIDASGVVLKSSSPEIPVGLCVLVTGCQLSETRDGGFSEILRVPIESVVALPDGLSLEESMILGTAGFTAALSLSRMLENHQKPNMGPILVTGASGGVGSVAISILNRLGFETWAVSSKQDQYGWLESLGAKRVLHPDELNLGQRPLETVRFGGAIDNVGGTLLSGVLRHTQLWGNVASVGLAGGADIATSVMPFILRGVSLLGVSSNNCPQARRLELWKRLAGPWRPDLKNLHVGQVKLDEVLKVAPRFLSREIHGRWTVNIKTGV